MAEKLTCAEALKRCAGGLCWDENGSICGQAFPRAWGLIWAALDIPNQLGGKISILVRKNSQIFERENDRRTYKAAEVAREHWEIEESRIQGELKSYGLTLDWPGLYPTLNCIPREDYRKALQDLWGRFGDIPMDPETEELEEPFLHFPKHTPRLDVWHWFDKRYPGGVTALLYPQR